MYDLFDQWLKPLRAFRLSNAGSIGVNPDQRMSADAQHLTELATDLLMGLVQSTLLLLSFIGVLWVLSEQMTVPFAGRHVYVPGYMVWCALLYAAAHRFRGAGRPLIALARRCGGGPAFARRANQTSRYYDLVKPVRGTSNIRHRAQRRATHVGATPD